MSILETIILAIVQGVAEFLPISSSAHLIIFRDVFNIGNNISGNMEIVFDVALHLGTLLAIGIFFFKDFITMINKGFTKGIKDKDGKIMWYIIIATIPAAIAGLLAEDLITNVIRGNLYVIAIALLVMGIIIFLADKFSESDNNLGKIKLRDAIIIGCSQMFALIPGFSRSGTTIATARILKIEKTDAAKFSFYLSAPVILGAVTLQLLEPNTISIITNNASIFIVGILVSFLIGILTIKFLLQYLQNNDFKIFMIYRVILAFVVIVIISI